MENQQFIFVKVKQGVFYLFRLYSHTSLPPWISISKYYGRCIQFLFDQYIIHSNFPYIRYFFCMCLLRLLESRLLVILIWKIMYFIFQNVDNVIKLTIRVSITGNAQYLEIYCVTFHMSCQNTNTLVVLKKKQFSPEVS